MQKTNNKKLKQVTESMLKFVGLLIMRKYKIYMYVQMYLYVSMAVDFAAHS